MAQTESAAPVLSTTYADFYRRSLDEPDAFWPEQAELIDWHRPFDQVCDHSNPPFATLVRRRADQPVPQRRRPPPGHAADQPALIFVSTETDQERRLQLPRTACRGAAHGRLPAGAGRQAGRPGADLHADDRRGGLRDAGLRAHRRDPLGGVRRLRQRQPGQPHRRCRAGGDRQRRCRQPLGQGGALQAPARRGDQPGQRTNRPRCCWSTAALRR